MVVEYLLAGRVSTCRRIWNFYRENRLQLTAVYCHRRGGVKGMYLAPHIHEHFTKGKGKVSIHFSADTDTVDTIYRIILSVNQLSIYGGSGSYMR